MANEQNPGIIQLRAEVGSTVFDVDGHKYVAVVIDNFFDTMRDALFELIQIAVSSSEDNGFVSMRSECLYFTLELYRIMELAGKGK